jgi:hypothetical protein
MLKLHLDKAPSETTTNGSSPYRRIPGSGHGRRGKASSWRKKAIPFSLNREFPSFPIKE